jgi:aminoglycoside phosphotransferase (APT) family kinase protein
MSRDALARPHGAPLPDRIVTVDLVRRLLRAQCPELAELSLSEVPGGWDNAIFRLGDELVVRVPVRSSAEELIANEARWLPVVAEGLPIATPRPGHVGRPTEDYPWTWFVAPWIDGDPVGALPVAERGSIVDDLAATLRALHRPAPSDAPRSRLRGIPLTGRIGAREQIVAVHGADSTLVSVWDEAVAAPAHAGPRLWLHGDPHPLNLLQRHGVLTGLVDFGDVNAGDPASDLACAWWLFGAEDRHRFRTRLAANDRYDEAVWTRAAGWAAMFSSLMAPGTSLHPSALHMAAELSADHVAGRLVGWR